MLSLVHQTSSCQCRRCFEDVLVIPNRPVKRLVDLSPEEVSSLFSTVQKVGKVVEEAYKADALTLACQVFSTSILFAGILFHLILFSCNRTGKQLVNPFRTFIFTYFLDVLKAIHLRTIMIGYILH